MARKNEAAVVHLAKARISRPHQHVKRANKRDTGKLYRGQGR